MTRQGSPSRRIYLFVTFPLASILMFAPLRRHLASVLGLLLVATTLSVAAVTAPTTTDDEVELAGCIGYCGYPRNAGKVFRWGREKWRYEFETGAFPRKVWKSTHPKQIGQQHGMLTIFANAGNRKVRTWGAVRAAKYGRWEARMRAVELAKTGQHFRFIWRLAPVNGTRCNSKVITLASYRPGDKRVRGAVRTRPSHSFSYAKGRDLRSRAWHAFAVEVTPDHISWFVDTRVVHTERRPAALQGYKLRPEFLIKGKKGQTMRRSMLQMDWVRHYTLDRKNAKSIKAPRMSRGTYTKGC